MSKADCQCGQATNVRCTWFGPENGVVEVEFMPEQFRASHSAAGNRGSYPHNGALRFRASRECAAHLLAEHGEFWVQTEDDL